MSLDLYLEIDFCESCGRKSEDLNFNITHNLNKMASAAGIYRHLWRPEEVGVRLANDLIAPIESSLKELKANPGEYRQYDSPNGWGTYNGFIPWLEELLETCQQYPKAKIRASR